MTLNGQKWRKPNSKGSEKIRGALGTKGIRQYELADALGISATSLSVMLRKGVAKEDETTIINVIEKLSRERGQCS